jgi:hypothetical protein
LPDIAIRQIKKNTAAKFTPKFHGVLFANRNSELLPTSRELLRPLEPRVIVPKTPETN